MLSITQGARADTLFEPIPKTVSKNLASKAGEKHTVSNYYQYSSTLKPASLTNFRARVESLYSSNQNQAVEISDNTSTVYFDNSNQTLGFDLNTTVGNVLSANDTIRSISKMNVERVIDGQIMPSTSALTEYVINIRDGNGRTSFITLNEHLAANINGSNYSVQVRKIGNGLAYTVSVQDLENAPVEELHTDQIVGEDTLD